MPGETDAAYHRGSQLSRLGRHTEALAAVDEFLLTAPGNANALMLRGAELVALHRDEEALDTFGEVVARDPGYAMGHYNRAMTLTGLGRDREALAAYDRAVASAPDQIFFRIRKGVALAGLGDLGSALTEFDAAYRVAPEKAGEAEAWAGAILWHRGDDQGARRRFARVKGRVSGNTAFDAAALEAIARCALGDPSGAERTLREAKSRHGSAHQDGLGPLYDLLAAPPLAGRGPASRHR